MSTPQVVAIRQLGAHVGAEVTVAGWVYNRTDKGKLQFLQVRDGTGLAQAVASQRDLAGRSLLGYGPTLAALGVGVWRIVEGSGYDGVFFIPQARNGPQA